jgi:AraC-like DNA-binding protein
MKLYIKNMVSARCKFAVKEELKKLNLHFIIVELGQVDIMEDLSSGQREQLKLALGSIGLELMDDQKAILIEKIKNSITEIVYYSAEFPRIKYSNYFSEKLHYNYTYLANKFSEVTGLSIQQYIIRNKIERIKELIIYDELSVSEIAWKMNYSSVAHLSNQFKKITGLTPSHFKHLKDKSRIPIEKVGMQMEMT